MQSRCCLPRRTRKKMDGSGARHPPTLLKQPLDGVFELISTLRIKGTRPMASVTTSATLEATAGAKPAPPNSNARAPKTIPPISENGRQFSPPSRTSRAQITTGSAAPGQRSHQDTPNRQNTPSCQSTTQLNPRHPRVRMACHILPAPSHVTTTVASARPMRAMAIVTVLLIGDQSSHAPD